MLLLSPANQWGNDCNNFYLFYIQIIILLQVRQVFFTIVQVFLPKEMPFWLILCFAVFISGRAIATAGDLSAEIGRIQAKAYFSAVLKGDVIPGRKG
jgi:hypothetical protein